MNKKEKIILSTLVGGLTSSLLVFAGLNAQALAAESSYDLTCRAKAKETAAEIYRGCVTEKKTAEIDRVRKDYQERLRNLKSEYDTELDKLGAKKVAKKQSLSRRQEPRSEPKVQLEVIPDESQMDLPEPIPVELSQ